MRRLLRRVLVTAAATLTAVGLATPAQASHGWVANSCVVQESLIALVKQDATGSYYEWIPCGTGLGGIIHVEARRPTYVNPIGPRGPFCLHTGWRYVPPTTGAVLSPTVRC